MALASGVTAVLHPSAVPVLPGVLELIQAGVVPGGTRSNEGFIEPFVKWAGEVDPETRTALADAQTSGGLLIAVPEDRAEALVERLKAAPTLVAALVGKLVEGTPGRIIVEA
jgi:selenide,water dikinase